MHGTEIYIKHEHVCYEHTRSCTHELTKTVRIYRGFQKIDDITSGMSLLSTYEELIPKLMPYIFQTHCVYIYIYIYIYIYMCVCVCVCVCVIPPEEI
jgi:hypothetical protein